MLKKYRGWLIVLCTLMVFLAAPGITAEAAPAKTKALKAYEKFLSKKEIAWDANYKVPAADCEFAIVYLDNDNVPELVLHNTSVPHMAGFGRIFTYKNGKVKRAGSVDMDNNAFCYYKKTSVFISCYVNGGVFDNYRTLTKGKLVHKLQKGITLPENKTRYYNANRKEISKSTFSKELKKLVGSKKKTRVKFYKNTSSGRKKHCR